MVLYPSAELVRMCKFSILMGSGRIQHRVFSCLTLAKMPSHQPLFFLCRAQAAVRGQQL